MRGCDPNQIRLNVLWAEFVKNDPELRALEKERYKIERRRAIKAQNQQRRDEWNKWRLSVVIELAERILMATTAVAVLVWILCGLA